MEQVGESLKCLFRLPSWCNGVCANYVTIPGYHGIEDAQTGWVASGKLAASARPAEKVMAGKEERVEVLQCNHYQK